MNRFLPADSSTFCSPRNCSLRKSRTVAGVAWSAWTKILASKAWPFLSLGGTCSFCTDTSLARATPMRHDIHRHAERLGGQHGAHGIADVLVAVGHAAPGASGRSPGKPRCPAGWRRPGRCAPCRRRPGSSAGPPRRWAMDSMLASVPKTITPALSTFFFCFGDAVDVFPGGFLLRRRDAVRAVQHEEDVHAFDRPQPLQAGQGEHQAQQAPAARMPSASPAPPRADLHVGLPAPTRSPRPAPASSSSR